MYMVWSLLHIRLLESGSNAQGDDQILHFLYMNKLAACLLLDVSFGDLVLSGLVKLP